jgi:hypothetical protein
MEFKVNPRADESALRRGLDFKPMADSNPLHLDHSKPDISLPNFADNFALPAHNDKNSQ